VKRSQQNAVLFYFARPLNSPGFLPHHTRDFLSIFARWPGKSGFFLRNQELLKQFRLRMVIGGLFLTKSGEKNILSNFSYF